MDDQHKMRVSDRDRQRVVDRLRSALEDGRLTMEEYVDRMEVAYQAATYGDLAPLCADLPAPAPVIAGPGPAAAAAAPPAVFSRAGYLAGLRRCSRSCGSNGWPSCRSTWSSGPWSAAPAVTWPTPGRSGWPARGGRCCSPCRLASRCSGAAARPSRTRGRPMADQIKFADPHGPQVERPTGAGSARLPGPGPVPTRPADPWLLDGAAEQTAATMLALLPEPVRAAYRDQWQPAYAALHRWNATIWGLPGGRYLPCGHRDAICARQSRLEP
jgi:hypothetical protein